jgi:hypothetical protein
MRMWIKRTLIICVALVAMPIAFLMVYLVSVCLKIDHYYESRPILNAMRQAYHDDASKSDLARDALLKALPIGTEAAIALAALSREGFECQKGTSPSSKPRSVEAALQKHAEETRKRTNAPEEMQLEREHLNCQLQAPAQVAHTQWVVNLQFDGHDQLAGAGVMVLHIFF